MKSYSTELTNVPSFMFNQTEDGVWHEEPAIKVEYYNGNVVLIQGKNEILIADKFLKNFCKEILANKEQADVLLFERNNLKSV